MSDYCNVIRAEGRTLLDMTRKDVLPAVIRYANELSEAVKLRGETSIPSEPLRGYLENLVSSTYEMIAEYVDRDPTKFCTTEEFEIAVDTMRTFLELRCESIQGQLEGTTLGAVFLLIFISHKVHPTFPL